MIQVGDRVSYFIGPHRGAGTVDKIGLPGNVVAVRRDDGNFAYPLVSECVPVEDAPESIVGVVLDEEPLLVDEPIDLEYVAPADEMTAASVDATTLIVRICDAGGIELDEIVTINGMTWQVVVRELPGGIPAE